MPAGVNLGEIYASIRLDVSGLTTGVQRVKMEVASMSQIVEKHASQIQAFGMKMALGVSAPLAAVGAAASKMAMDAVESENLFEVSMGNMANAARDWSKQLRSELGLNEYEVRKNVGTFNVMINSMGVASDKSFDMAKGFTQLAYDMASFYNLKPDQAFEKLRAGLSGEIEPLKQLGIVVTEDMTKRAAWTSGLAKQGAALTEAQKVQARYMIIMDQTAKAQGDLARTIDSPANQLRILVGEIQQVAIEFGQAMIPAIQSAIAVLKEGAQWLGELSPAAKSGVIGLAVLVAGIGPLLIGIGSLAGACSSISTIVMPLFASVFSGPVLAAIAGVAAAIVGLTALYKYLGRDTQDEARAASENARSKYEQAQKTQQLVTETQKLADNHHRSAAESKLYHDNLQKIAELNPNLISGFDKMGNAIGLTTDALRKANIEAALWMKSWKQAELTRNTAETNALKSQLSSAKETAALRAKELNSGQKVVDAAVGFSGSQVVYGPLTRTDKERYTKDLREQNEAVGKINSQLAQKAKERQDILSGIMPGASTPTRTSTGIGTGGKPAKPAKGMSAQQLRELGASNTVNDIRQQYDALKDKFTNLLGAKNTKGATEALSAMNKKTLELVGAYGDLEKVKLAGVKTTEEKTAIEIESTDSQRAALQAYAGDRKRLQEADKAASDKKRAEDAQDAQDIVDLENAVIQAQAESAAAFAEYQKKKSDAKAKELADSLKMLDYERAHNRVSVEEYVAALQTKQASLEQFSDAWMDIQGRIEAANADEAQRTIDLAEVVAEKDKAAALEMLKVRLEAYKAMGDAGVEAAKRIQDAIDDLGKKKEKDKKDTIDWGKVWADEITKIGNEFASSMANMIVDGGKFKDFMKQLWKDVLKWAIETLVKIAIQSAMTGESTKSIFGKMFGGTDGKTGNPLTNAGNWFSKGGFFQGLGGAWGSLATAGLALDAGGIVKTIGSIGKTVKKWFTFDDPINDTAAVRSGADFSRLFRQGAESEIGRAVQSSRSQAQPVTQAAPTTTNHVTVTTHIDKVSGIDDLARITETQAWMISRKLNLAPTG